MIELTYLSHCVYHCDYHIVILTKYRKKVFNRGIFAYLKLKLKEITKHYPVINIKRINHDRDHIHLLISIPPTMSVGKVVGLIKQNTSSSLKQKFSILKSIYWGTDAVWSDGYFVSTIGVDEKVIKKYIEEQGKKDSGQIKFELY